MNAKQLAEQLEGLGHSARHRYLVHLSANPDIEPLIDSLAMGEAHEACMALVLADHSDRTPVIAALIDHRSWTVRRLVARNMARRGLAIDYARLDDATRGEWLQQVASLNQTHLADSVIDDVRSRYGDHAGGLLLRAASSAVVERLLPEIAHTFTTWTRFAKRHPDLLLDYIETCFQNALPSCEVSLWARFSTAWPVLARLRSAEVGRLIDAHTPADTLPPIPLGAIDDAQLRRLMLRTTMQPFIRQRGLPPGLLRRLERWPDDDLVTLLVRMGKGQAWSMGEVLQRLSPERRGRLFERLLAQQVEAPWPDTLIRALPSEIRAREADRKLEQASLRGAIHSLTSALANARPEVALPELETLRRSTDASHRGLARGAFLSNGIRYHRSLTDTLETLAPEMRNDQDPTRSAPISAMREAKTAAWTDSAITVAQQVFTDAIGARDCSNATHSAIRAMGVRWLNMGVSSGSNTLLRAGIEVMRQLVENIEQLRLPKLDHIHPSAVHPLIDALRPHLEDANARERYAVVLQVAQSLGARAGESAFLQDRLEEAVFSKIPWVANQALNAWLRDRATRDDRVRTLLARDASMVVHPMVFHHLHLRRQEWLDHLLTHNLLQGVFRTGRTRSLLPMHRSGYFRWTPRQQRIYADTLAAAANDDGHPTRDRVALLQTLARMPTSTLETLTPWLESTDVTLQEAALGASVWTATPTEAIPVLAAHLGGDRARVAMYAFQRCMRFLASGQLRRVLQVLLRESHKITVVKEVLRLHGRYRVDGAVDLLCGVLSDPSRHRDVRIAALSGLRDHLDSDGVFEAIASAVASESDLSSAIILDPTALASRHRRRWYALMEPLFQNEDPLVRQTAFAAGRAWLQACPREMACAAAVCIADLETGTEWRTACTLLSSAASDGIGHESVLEAIQQLTSCSQPHAEVHRDRPATQRRDALLNALLELPPHTQPRRAPLLQSLHALFSHDDAALLQMRIALHLTDDDHMATVLEAQAERIATHPEDLLEWATTTVVTLERIPGLTQRALSVASAAPWPARALAITLLGRVAATSGWTAELRSTLSVLRQDDDPRVRNRALRLYTHRE